MDNCAKCAEYEERVMAQASDDDVPEPCDHYQMSDKFRDWIVGRMQDEVTRQVSGAGLDRMAIVKAKDEDNA